MKFVDDQQTMGGGVGYYDCEAPRRLDSAAPGQI